MTSAKGTSKRRRAGSPPHAAKPALRRPPSDLKSVIQQYYLQHASAAQQEASWFKMQRSVVEAIRLAALAQGPGGKRLQHQRRIPALVLENVAHRLLSHVPAIAQARTFKQLHKTIGTLIGTIPGAGELLVYDAALRIGIRLGLHPKAVYLHAGTRVGAKNMGLAASRKSIPLRAFPPDLRHLPAEELEDLLCVYKDVLGPGGSVSAPPALKGKAARVPKRR